MECNREEAIRAKEIAEKKFLEKDIRGARKFVFKAQSLYPGLEGVPQMLATFDIYAAAENRINGDSDWYGILGVSPRADDETVRKRYRKLALMLHPDKNKSVGGEGAFKLLSQAWSLLSDKAKKSAYDEKNAKFFGRVSTAAGTSSSKVSNGFHNFAKSSVKSTVKSQNTTHAAKSVPASSHKAKTNTFWTACHRCRMQYEYLRVYLNHNLLCPNCHEPFLAIETAPPPSNGIKEWKFDEWSPFCKKGRASTAAQAATVVQQAYEKVRREREEAQAATKREEALKRKYNAYKRMGASSSGNSFTKKRRATGDVGPNSYGYKGTNQPVSGSIKVDTADISGSTNPHFMRDVSELDIRTALIKKAEMEIHKKFNDLNSGARTEVSLIEGKEDSKEKCSENHEMHDRKNYRMRLAIDGIRSSPGNSISGTEEETVERMTIMVPDPDFHDFDKHRTERCFEKNQVWAAYDDDDGMPRYYAMIQRVISLKPFQIRIRWLYSKTNSELGPLNWVVSGFSKTCGEFRLGRYEICNSLNSFSHKVGCTKRTDGLISIYPRRGEVWALYRNWSPDWNEVTAYEVIHEYDMVEVLEDYSEELGVVVIPLVKVARFKTLFHQHLDPRETRRIPREEMFRFSHRVPSYLLTDQEEATALKDCRELDPAATPTEFLQIIMDAKEEDILENKETLKSGKVSG